MSRTITIGTRGSRLALAQAHMTRAALIKASLLPEDAIDIKIITTTGDRIQDRSLIEAGGKGLFTKEIEEALLDGTIDVAVHSAKDMPAAIPKGLRLAACLPREDVRDCLIGKRVNELPQGAVLGTSSPRRAALMKRLRPDLRIVDFRGNVDTRIAKIERGEADASLLALAGLKRIGLEAAAAEILSVDDCLPAIGQGAIALECRSGDGRMEIFLDKINHKPTYTALLTERAFLNVLDGSCRTPIAGLATVANDSVQFKGMILKPDGSLFFECTRTGNVDDAEEMGLDAGQELKAAAPSDFFA